MTEPRSAPDRLPGTALTLAGRDWYALLDQQLRRAVNNVCPSWLRSQADDIVQAALIRVMEIDKKGEGVGVSTASYVRKVAYTVTVDEIRRLRRRRESSLDNASEPMDRGNPERDLARREMGQSIQDCLVGLVMTRRRAVGLYLMGHSVPEASRILGWGRKKVENLVFRGLADLRSCLTGKRVLP